MFVKMYENAFLPVKGWVEDDSRLDALCMEQAEHLSRLPFLYKHVALMPDAHAGMGMPIGGVIAAVNAIIPNAVGVDIGCGMAFTATDLPVAALRETKTDSESILTLEKTQSGGVKAIYKGKTLVEAIVQDILFNVPVGFAHHKRPQPSYTLDAAIGDMETYAPWTELTGQLDAGYYQIGTLGGGNHFIELQEDDDGMLGIMIHSGSRNFGKQVCDYFHRLAAELNQKWHSAVPAEWRLAFLPADTAEGRGYIDWMKLAMDFAYENRARMMLAVKAVVEKWAGMRLGLDVSYTDEINCHHNYAALEHHYGKNVWVHRKGATRAREGERAVIPGAMGSYSYVVEGLGNPLSFCSSSHGAGRRLTRTQAKKDYTSFEVMEDLSAAGVVLGKHGLADVAEESRFAYKDIDGVMDNQSDLVRPVRRLKTVGVVKG